jgi:NADPH-dependent ferric siderophore reductase
MPFGGIEFDPGAARSLLLVGDETAVPAICRILEDLPASARGTAFLEVPHRDDVAAVRPLPGVEVIWLPRDGAPLGTPVREAVTGHLDAPTTHVDEPDEVDPDLWETPSYSSSGESIETAVSIGHDLEGLYAWIAGEAGVVTSLRRYLVRELGMDRRQVAFMGYWRRGVAMRS